MEAATKLVTGAVYKSSKLGWGWNFWGSETGCTSPHPTPQPRTKGEAHLPHATAAGTTGSLHGEATGCSPLAPEETLMGQCVGSWQPGQRAEGQGH